MENTVSQFSVEAFNHRQMLLLKSYASSIRHNELHAEIETRRALFQRDGRKRRGCLIRAEKLRKQAQQYAEIIMERIRLV